jgi:Domain of unknown function (DUF4286)
MVIYNVTTSVSWGIHDSWLNWLKNQQIPAILSTGCFYEFRLLRLLEVDQSDGPTYAIQYYAVSENDYRQFIADHAAFFSQQIFDKWGDQILTFGSVMEVLP